MKANKTHYVSVNLVWWDDYSILKDGNDRNVYELII